MTLEQRLEWCVHKARVFQELPEARRNKDDFPQGPLERTRLCQHLDFKLLASWTVERIHSVASRHPVCDGLLGQFQETNPGFKGWVPDLFAGPHLLALFFLLPRGSRIGPIFLFFQQRHHLLVSPHPDPAPAWHPIPSSSFSCWQANSPLSASVDFPVSTVDRQPHK